MLTSPLRYVAKHTSSVGRETLLDATSVAALLAADGGKLTAVLKGQGEQQGGHDGGEEHKGEDSDGERGGGKHGRRA